MDEKLANLHSNSAQWVEIASGRVRYFTAGAGPPLVLLHGLVAYSFSWRLVLPTLAQHFKVYALDMPGSGFSDCPPNLEGGLAANAQRLLEILDALQIASCNLVGTSYGGAIAMAAASIIPNRIVRLVLSAPVNPWSNHGKLLAPLLSHLLVAPVFMRIYPRIGFVQGHFLRRLFGGSSCIPADSLQGYAAAMRNPEVMKYALKTIRSWNSDLRYLEQLLPQIWHIPTLLLWGSEDGAVFSHSAGRLREHFENSQLIVFDGVGHLPYEEVPEAFTSAVLKFLC